MIYNKEGTDQGLDFYRETHNVLDFIQDPAGAAPGHRVRVVEVKVDPDPGKGEVYLLGHRGQGNLREPVLALGKSALLKLASAAGIHWDWEGTRPLEASRDYVLYQAVGGLRKPCGEWLTLKGTKEIDLEVVEKEALREQLSRCREMDPALFREHTPEEWKEIIQEEVAATALRWRKNKLMWAETGAMLRVVRNLLNLRPTYSPGELGRPFAVPVVEPAPDYRDPGAAQALYLEGLRAREDLFGATPRQGWTSREGWTSQGGSPGHGGYPVTGKSPAPGGYPGTGGSPGPVGYPVTGKRPVPGGYPAPGGYRVTGESPAPGGHPGQGR